MAERPGPPPRSSALADRFPPGTYGAAPGGGVRLGERVVPALWSVVGVPVGDVLPAAATAVAGGVMHEVRDGGVGGRFLAVGPRQWTVLLEGEPGAAGDPVGRAFGPRARVFDLTHGRALVRLDGDRAPGVIEKGCPLDLTRLGPGLGAATVLGPFAVVLMRDAAGFEVLLDRSFARAGWGWLVRAALEFGCEVEPARGWRLRDSQQVPGTRLERVGGSL